MAKLIGIGSALVDQLAHVPESLLDGVPGGKGGMELVERHHMVDLLARLPIPPSRVSGGSAANTAVGVARLGMSAGLLTKIGDDERGRYYRARVEDAGLDTAAFKVSADVATGTCLCLITPDSQRTMRTYLGASATLEPGDIGVGDFSGCTHAYVEGYLLFSQALMHHVLKTAARAGCSIALDLAAPEVVRASSEILPDILRKHVDIVLANEDEARAFAGTSDEREALAALSRLCRIAVVKLGARGALIRSGVDTYEIPARKVRAVDTTGAGDLWAAGFMYGLCRGMSLPQAGAAGAVLGAEVVKVTGAALPAETWSRLRSEITA